MSNVAHVSGLPITYCPFGLLTVILLYGCEIWGFGNNDVLEKVHLKFCKLILNLKTSTPNYMIYSELGRYPVEIHIKIRIISFRAKIICGKQSKISCIMYSLSHHLYSQQNFDIKWIKCLEKIFNETGFLIYGKHKLSKASSG